MRKWWLEDARREVGLYPSVGLLVLRLGVGLSMALAHGWPKVGRLLGDDPIRFADPFGIGETPSLVLAIFGELGCGLLIALGLGTRLATIPFAVTMLVAMFYAHGDDPWRMKEPAFLFLVPAITLLFAGPGRLSLDALVVDRLRARSKSAGANDSSNADARPAKAG